MSAWENKADGKEIGKVILKLAWGIVGEQEKDYPWAIGHQQIPFYSTQEGRRKLSRAEGEKQHSFEETIQPADDKWD